MNEKEYIVPLNEWDIADGYWGNPQELIRCRDCRWYEGHDQYCEKEIIAVEDGHCHFAKRKEE